MHVWNTYNEFPRRKFQFFADFNPISFVFFPVSYVKLCTSSRSFTDAAVDSVAMANVHETIYGKQPKNRMMQNISEIKIKHKTVFGHIKTSRIMETNKFR